MLHRHVSTVSQDGQIKLHFVKVTWPPLVPLTKILYYCDIIQWVTLQPWLEAEQCGSRVIKCHFWNCKQVAAAPDVVTPTRRDHGPDSDQNYNWNTCICLVDQLRLHVNDYVMHCYTSDPLIMSLSSLCPLFFLLLLNNPRFTSSCRIPTLH